MSAETPKEPTRLKVRRRASPPLTRATVVRLKTMPCDLTLPIIFLMLARQSGKAVKAYPHSKRPDVWCFRFSNHDLLELSTAGEAEWVCGSVGIRRQVFAILDIARARHAALTPVDIPRIAVAS